MSILRALSLNSLEVGTRIAWTLCFAAAPLGADESKTAQDQATELYAKLLGHYHMPKLSCPAAPDTVSYQLFVIPVRVNESLSPPQYPIITTAVFKLSKDQWPTSGVISIHAVRHGETKKAGEITLDDGKSNEVIRQIAVSEVFSLSAKSALAEYESHGGGFDGTRYTLFRFDSGGIRAVTRLDGRSEPMVAALHALYPHLKEILDRLDSEDKSGNK